MLAPHKLVVVGPLQADVPVLLVVCAPDLRQMFVLLQQRPVEVLLLFPHKNVLLRPLHVSMAVLLLSCIPYENML